MLIDKQINLYIDWCKLDAGFTPATIETKRYNLLKFKQQTKITDISEFNSRKFTEWKMAMLTGEFGGIKYTPQTCNNRIKTVITFIKWCKDMGIKTGNNGASLQEVQHLLRHASINTTEIYVHNLQNSLGDIYKRLKCEKFL